MHSRNALLHLRKAGGHPGICGLREHFNERGHYFLILDLVAGGEMFEHLVNMKHLVLECRHPVECVAQKYSFFLDHR